MQTESEHYRRYRSFIDPDGRDMGSVRVNGIQDDLNSKNITLNDNDEFVIQAILYDSSNQPQSPLAILLPNKMKQISNTDYGDATISNVTKIDDKTYNVTLSATKIVPVLWLDINPSTKEKYQLLYWFSDNGFTMTEPQISVTLTIFSSNETTTLSAQDLTISRMKMSSNPTAPTSSNPTAPTSSNPMTPTSSNPMTPTNKIKSTQLRFKPETLRLKSWSTTTEPSSR
uniref:Beta-mannosidase n=1 Tax=Acrobeloides nanus TaxID=290746 RepID=A0A914CHL9_9BILA